MVNIPYRYNNRTRWQRIKYRVKDWVGAILALGGLGGILAIIVCLFLLPIAWFALIAYAVVTLLSKLG